MMYVKAEKDSPVFFPALPVGNRSGSPLYQFLTELKTSYSSPVFHICFWETVSICVTF